MVALALVLVVLVAHNLVGNLVLPPMLYVPVNLAVAPCSSGLPGQAKSLGTTWG